MSGPPPVETPVDPVRAAESNVGQIIGVTSAFHFVALIVVGLRFYVRAGLVKACGRDDWTMVASALCALGGWIIFVIQSFHGLGHHEDTIDPMDKMTFQHVGFWQSIISASCAMALLKISIALNLLRLSQNRWYSWSLWASIAFVSAYSFMGVMTFFLHCTPMEFHWDKRIEGGKCYPLKLFINFSLINTAFNIFTDILFATFPIPIIWKLQMRLRTRLYLIGILSLGYFAVVMGILKAVYQIAFATDRDKTFHQWVQFWGFLQLNLGIIAACAPSLKPLVNKALKLSDYYGTPGYGNSHSHSHSHRLPSNRTPVRNSPFQRPGDFELGERSPNQPRNEATVTTFYKTRSSGDRSGSEEFILAHGQGDQFKGGIMRTTEVTVT